MFRHVCSSSASRNCLVFKVSYQGSPRLKYINGLEDQELCKCGIVFLVYGSGVFTPVKLRIGRVDGLSVEFRTKMPVLYVVYSNHNLIEQIV